MDGRTDMYGEANKENFYSFCWERDDSLLLMQQS